MSEELRISGKNEDVRFKYARGRIDVCYDNMFHNHYEIHLLLGGTVDLICDNSVNRLSPFNLSIIPPGEYHAFSVKDKVDEYERIVFEIKKSLFKEGEIEAALERKRILSFPKDHRVIQNALYLRQCLGNYSREDFSEVLSAITKDIIILIKQGAKVSEIPFSGKTSTPFAIMNYINENYRNNITLEDIADCFFLSVSSVCHIFQSTYGISVKKYITNLRMSEARIMLDRGKKAYEVCNELGFTYYSTFYRAYKNHFGVFPSDKKENI